MSDRLARVLCQEEGVVALACIVTDCAREARTRHQLAPSSAALLGEAFAAASLVAALQKSDKNKVNLQLECDGPAQGLFVDADPAGTVRGYVKSKQVAFPPAPRFESASMLGSSGYVAFLRERDGEFYRGMVPLGTGGLMTNVEAYFSGSEQIPTAIQLEALDRGGDALGLVGGVLVQVLPGGDASLVDRARGLLRAGAFRDGVGGGKTLLRVLEDLMKAAGAASAELVADGALAFRCTCSKERVLTALATLHPGELFEMIHHDHGAATTCEFCSTPYTVSEAELQALLDAIDEKDARTEAEDAKGGKSGGRS